MTATGSLTALGRTGLSEDPLTLGTYLEWWLAQTRSRVRPTTYSGYETLVRRHARPRIGHLPLGDVRPLHLQGMYSDLLAGGELSSGTVRNVHLVMTQSLGQAVRWGIIAASVGLLVGYLVSGRF